MTLGVVLFVLAIGVSIMLHEAGHLLTAKKFGMKATQYFVGFGPTLWSFQRGETEYGVKAIPAGGFVKIVGMTPLEDVPPGDEERAFYKQPAGKRAVVLVAGSVTHFLVAFFVIYIAAVGVGLPTDRALIGEVSPCVVVDYDPERQDCSSSDPRSPASQAGLKEGDEILAVGRTRVADYAEAQRAIRASGAGPTTVRVQRGDEVLTLPVTLLGVERPKSPDNDEDLVRVGALGIAMDANQSAREGPIAGIGRSGELMGDMFVATFKAVAAFPEKIPRLFDALMGDERDEDTPISVIGAARVGGQAVQADQVLAALGLLAGLNVFIGVFNLFPLLPLDGGHLAVLGFEQARSRIARAFGRRDPGRVDLLKLMPVAYVVILLFGGLTLLTVTADIVNPIANPFAQ